MDAPNARIVLQHSQRFLRENGAAGSGHTHGNRLSFVRRHGIVCGSFSLAAARRQVKLSPGVAPMLRCVAVEDDEIRRTFETFAGGGVPGPYLRNGPWQAETSAGRRHRPRPSGPSTRAAPQL